MSTTFALVIVIIIIAVIFDFLNGFNDAANSIATIVVTKTLSPAQAILMAGFANFIGFFLCSGAIAKTIGKGIIYPQHVSLQIVLAALIGAVLWSIITSWLGLPISCSHALIGGLIGSGLAAAGYKAIVLSGIVKILLFIVIAPLLGMLGSILFSVLVLILFRKTKPAKANSLFKKLQIISSFFYSLGHGTNDAQKTMGIITLALFTGGFTNNFHIQNWVALLCYLAIGLGTACGGWRIIKTMGTKISKIECMEGFCAETASALVLMGTAHTGIPVSTTHVIAGAIMGVGVTKSINKVRWITVRSILWAWILTIPLTALCSGLVYIIL